MNQAIKTRKGMHALSAEKMVASSACSGSREAKEKHTGKSPEGCRVGRMRSKKTKPAKPMLQSVTREKY